MRNKLPQIFIYLLLAIWLVIVAVPFLWLLVSALRTSQEFVANPFGIPWIFTGAPEGYGDPVQGFVNNFRNAWVESNFSRYFVNSVIVTVISLAGILGVGSLAAYALARFDFRGNRILFLYFIGGMMVPAQLVLIPLFFQFSTMAEIGSAVLAPLGLELVLHDTFTGIILIYIAVSLPFTILILTGFFRTLPEELREAAILDGCGEGRIFWQVMLPLARPGLVAAGIFNFIGLWNEYLFALVFLTGPDKKTLPLGLAGVSMQAQYRTDFGLLFAGLVIVIIPTLLAYLVMQRQLTQGITMGALKG